MVYVIHINDTKLQKRFTGLKWVFISHGKEGYRMPGALDAAMRRFVGKDIEKITDSVRDNFVDLIGKVSLQQKNRVLWYSSPIASKSVSQTSMFQYYVYLKLLEQLSEDKEDHLFVTDDIGFLCNVSLVRMKDVRVLAGIRIRAAAYRLDAVFKNLKSDVKFILRWMATKISIQKNSAAQYDVLIHSWIDDRVFGSGRYNDVYFRGLYDFISAADRRVARLMPLSVKISDLLRLKRICADIVCPMHYLKLSDITRAFWSKFRIDLDLKGIDGIKDIAILAGLLKNEEKKERMMKAYRTYLMYYYSYLNIDKALSASAAIIYPFENQPWEKMLHMAFPRRIRIGCQHTIIPDNWLDYRVSRFERNMPSPSSILTAGRKWTEALRASFGSSLAIEEAGALRLFYQMPAGMKDRVLSAHNITVALPIYPEIAVSLQLQLLSMLAEKDSVLAGYELVIKPHPYLSRSSVLSEEFGKYKNCRFVNTDMQELIRDSAALVTSSSTVAYDSVFLGCKTLYFIPESFCDGTDRPIRDFLFVAYESDFKDKMTGMLEGSETRASFVDKDEYFSKPDYGKFLKHLEVS